MEFVSVKEKNEQPQAGDVDDNVLGFLRLTRKSAAKQFEVRHFAGVNFSGVWIVHFLLSGTSSVLSPPDSERTLFAE